MVNNILNQLPENICLEILSHLNIKKQVEISIVSKQFSSLCAKSPSWEEFARRNFSPTLITTMGQITKEKVLALACSLISEYTKLFPELNVNKNIVEQLEFWNAYLDNSRNFVECIKRAYPEHPHGDFC